MTEGSPKRIGRPRSLNGTARILVRVRDDLLDAIEAAALKERRSRDEWIRRAIEAALRQ